MASGPFSKQAIYIAAKLNANYTDSVIGGALSTAPSGLQANQGQQTLPGDRILLSPSDAYAASNNNNAVLYTGSYRYVAIKNNSSSNPTLGHGAFWVDATGANNNALDAQYQVQSDEAANFGVVQYAGAFLKNVTLNNTTNYYWWIQESGKCTLAFRNAITGTPAIAAGVYLAGAGNNNNAVDVGAFDQLVAGNSAAIFAANSITAYTTVDNMLIRYMGPALTLPANNNTALVDVEFGRASFRF